MSEMPDHCDMFKMATSSRVGSNGLSKGRYSLSRLSSTFLKLPYLLSTEVNVKVLPRCDRSETRQATYFEIFQCET